jgi:hypothetical protein
VRRSSCTGIPCGDRHRDNFEQDALRVQPRRALWRKDVGGDVRWRHVNCLTAARHLNCYHIGCMVTGPSGQIGKPFAVRETYRSIRCA